MSVTRVELVVDVGHAPAAVVIRGGEVDRSVTGVSGVCVACCHWGRLVCRCRWGRVGAHREDPEQAYCGDDEPHQIPCHSHCVYTSVCAEKQSLCLLYTSPSPRD